MRFRIGTRTPRDVDSRTRSEWFGIGAPILLILVIAEMMLHATGRLGRPAYLFAFWVVNPPLTFGLAWIVSGILEQISRGLIATTAATASTEPIRQYSEQDALVMQGRFAEAAEMYRAIIADEPGNIVARLRLANLHELHLRDDEAAVALFLEVRRMGPTERQELVVANGLIDSYRRLGRIEDLKRELTRMARRREGTPEGDGARRYLRALMEEHRQPGQP